MRDGCACACSWLQVKSRHKARTARVLAHKVLAALVVDEDGQAEGHGQRPPLALEREQAQTLCMCVQARKSEHNRHSVLEPPTQQP